MVKKNDIVKIDIEDIGINGEGIGRIDGYTLFVKDAVVGDYIEAKIMKANKSYGYARVMNILTPSPYRVDAVCPVARSCGGCQLQELSYEKQLEFKRNKVANNLKKIGHLENVTVNPVLGMDEPFRYRNKAQFPVGLNKDGEIIMGFYAGRTHSIIECEDCLLGVTENTQILNIVKNYMKSCGVMPYDEGTGKGLMRHILIRKGFKTGDIMVCLVINGKKLPAAEKLVDALKVIPGMTSISYNINTKNTNVILGNEVVNLYGEGYITDYIKDVKFQISPLSFYQVNPVQTEVLYGKALEFAGLTGKENVWDLYCGIGTISLFLAKAAGSVKGVEIVPQAIEDAKNNARINGITNAEFFVGKSEEVLPEYYERNGGYADVIVVDPPRKGCDEALLETLIRMKPKRVVYVSCDSATLARDLKYLCENGYEVKEVQPVDMFPMGGHVETVVLLSQQKADDYIEVELELDELDLTSAESKATYMEIQEYVLKEHGLKVSNLYISQVKNAIKDDCVRKCGIEVGENYNLPKSEDSRQPQCPEEKEKAIKDALEHFGMV
ncbi:MAG: 23S rRNA (uracil(1939)-C(5))-methyltransferase RlmD [Lachnospira sp.]|nr:23S rRNA (uracil(1939)-C(5))-methyltransferase RlmD [Lachnospira sp.]